MTDIPNTEYITINKDGIFVGGKPATTYRGEKIFCIDDVREFFKSIQKTHPNIAELHVLSSETLGRYAVAGNPSGKYGSNSWCRVVLNDGTVGSWIFHSAYFVNTYCASYGAHGCALYLCTHPEFSAAVFKQKTQKPINPVVVAANNNAQNKR